MVMRLGRMRSRPENIEKKKKKKSKKRNLAFISLIAWVETNCQGRWSAEHKESDR
jgi:hypothetical protein